MKFKRIYVMFIIGIFLTSGLSLLVMNNVNTNNSISNDALTSGFTSYTIPIEYKNYTLPQYDYNLTDIQHPKSNTVLTKYSPTHTLTAYYYGNKQSLYRYVIDNGSFTNLSSFVSLSSSYDNILEPIILQNNSVVGIGGIGFSGTDVEYDYYSLTNNTNYKYITSITGTNQVSYYFTNNVFYWSYTSSNNGTLYNTWINLYSHKYFYLNFSIPNGWNTIAYSSYLNAYLMNSNNATSHTNIYYYVYYNSSANNYQYKTSISNVASFITAGDTNNMPYAESKYSNGTVVISGLNGIDNVNGAVGNQIHSYSSILYVYTNDTFKNIVGSEYTDFTTTDSNAYIFNIQNQYQIVGQYSNSINTYQNAFTNVINDTVLLTNSTWFNNYFTSTLIGANPSYLATAYYGYSGWENALEDKGNGNIFVWWNPNKVNEFSPSKVISTFNLTIKEDGLSSGTQWSYTFNSHSYTLTNSSYIYFEPNGTYSLKVNNISGYSVKYSSSIIINGNNEISYVNFTANITSSTFYMFSITESGLASNIQWSFNFNNVNYTTISTTQVNINVSNGTYHLKVYNIRDYTVSYPSNITINGGNDFIVVKFTIITYKITFTEFGLQIPTTWKFNLSDTEYSLINDTSISISRSNGTYNLLVYNVSGYKVKYPSTIIVNGSDLNVSIVFTQVIFSITIIELGLETGAQWSYIFNGSVYTLINSSYVYLEPNGTYDLKVNNVSHYTVNYLSSIVVNGKNIIIDVNFTKIYYKVDFKIFGLPANTSWAILINNTEYISNSTSILIELPSGIYNPVIIIPNGYSLNDVGTLVVNGNTSYYIQISESPFNFITQNISYIVVFIFIMMIFLIAIALRRRREE